MFGKKSALAVFGVLCGSGLARADLVNGDFQLPPSPWWMINPGGNVSHFTDSGGDGFVAMFEPDIPGPASTYMFQNFIVGSGSASLSFEYSFYSDGIFRDDGHTLPDAFTISLLDRCTLSPLVGTSSYFYHDARGAADSIRYDASLVTLTSTASRPDWWTVRVDLSSIAAGTEARLQFDLFGTGPLDGQVTYATIDGVSTTVIAVPPAILLGWIGLGIVGGCRARRHRAPDGADGRRFDRA